ncbi:MAG: endonuclease III [Clostridia bacterium]|nr:endonuclease III [Clostridia bacterium]
MTKKQRALEVIELLKQQYPDAICSLEYTDPFQLLVSTRLAAQCTDARVNMVTPALFAKYPTPQVMATATPEEIEPFIRSCGLYKTKARDLALLSRMLCEEFGGEVPDTLEQLTRLPGIGRKTANLVCGDIFGKPAVVTDTHCIRISGRLHLTDSKDPYKVEMALKKLLPPEESNDFCHRLVLFGRDICSARSPKCGICPLAHLCPSAEHK